jgi:hypothetical protein
MLLYLPRASKACQAAARDPTSDTVHTDRIIGSTIPRKLNHIGISGNNNLPDTGGIPDLC